MKRILFLLFAIGLTVGTTAMAGMSTSKVRKETRFLTDKMAYELSLSTQQYNDAYEINYDFIYSVRNIMDYVARGYEWALDDYYEALDIRNDDLRWVLSDAQYRRFLGTDYFYRPIYITGGRWSFRVYVNYPNRSLFYFGLPYHYRTYCGAHYRPHLHHVSFYRDRYNFRHYPTPYRVREQRSFHSYRRSDFGSVHFRPNSSVRPHNAPTRPGVTGRPSPSQRPSHNSRPGTSTRPGTATRPGTTTQLELFLLPAVVIRNAVALLIGPEHHQLPQAILIQIVDRREVAVRQQAVLIVRVVARVQVEEMIVVRPVAAVALRPVEIIVPIEVTLPLAGAAVPVAVAVLPVRAVAVVLTGAMFPVEKRKDVPLPKVREAAVEVLLPVLQSETPIQEDNLFL